jgi:hypothetical protein
MAYGSVTAQSFALASIFGSSKRAGAPTTLYFALTYEAADPTGTLGAEPAIGTGGYARVPITNDDALWSINTGNATMTNLVVVSWPISTAAWTVTTVNQWAVFDAASGGDCWAFDQLTNDVTVDVAGRRPVGPIGGFDIIQLAAA